MDRSREARSSSSIVASNGTSRRRNRAATFRDLPEEGQVELQEMVRLKERASKRDRDREFASRRKRRRGGANREEEVEEEEGGDTSVEDTIADEDSDEVEDGGGSASNQNQRRSSLPIRVGKQQWKIADDAMIGVPVPRKARSVSVKRSHDCTVSGNSGVGGVVEDIADDQSHRNLLDSPARSSAEVVSPSASIVSMKKKMKPSGSKTRKPKTSKGSSLSEKEGDIEIEIAEVLYGLMKQSHHGKPSTNHETEDSPVLRDDGKSSVALGTASYVKTSFQKTVLHQNDDAISDLLVSVALEKNEEVHDSSSPLAQKATSEFNKNLSSHEFQTEVAMEEGGEITESKKTVSEELPPCSKFDVDHVDSIPSKSIAEAAIQKDEKYKIDLMAPPTSPERNGLADTLSDAPLSLGVKMEKEDSNKVEKKVEGFKEKEKIIDEVKDKVVKSGKKLELFELDLEKPHLDGITMKEQSQKQQSKRTAGTVERNETSTSVHLPITLGGWPSAEIPTAGCIPPFRTVVPMDRGDKSSTKLQHPNFILSHPRPKRCLTHYDIARNIYLHQQFTKTNYYQPAADASASLVEAKLKIMSSAESKIVNDPLHGNNLDVNLSSVQQMEHAAADFPGNGVTDKTPEPANFIDMAKNKQLVFQQTQGTSFGNSMAGPRFMFPIGRHQAPIAATANQSGSSKSSNSTTSLYPEAGKLDSFSGLPAVSSNMSYSHPSQVSMEAPYFSNLQNNGYAFTFSTPAGTTTYRGNSAQGVPFFNGSFFPSQQFHPSPVAPPQTFSQTQSHKQPQTQQQQWSGHGNNLLPSNGMQLKQSKEQHLPLSNQSRKHESETSGEETKKSVSDSKTSQVQKNVYGQNFIVPVQALNFALMPSAALGNGNGNHGEKKQSHLVSSQAVTMSFASFNGNGTPSTLNFTPATQNTNVFQNHFAPQSTKQKNHQISEARKEAILSNPGNSGKASANSGQTLVFNNSARTLNFMSSPVPGNWPPTTIKSAASTTNRPPAVGPPGAQQQPQLLQLQQQHMLLQPQATMIPRTKVPANCSLPSSSVATKFSYNAPGFSPSLVQCDNLIQSPLPKNSGTTVASIVPMTSLHLASSTAIHKKGQTQISFGGDFKPSYVQMQQIPSSSHSPPSSGTLKNSTGNKTGSSAGNSQSKQDESSTMGAGQKSSPVCGRNVPSIVNPCPGRLFELKY